MFTLKSLADVYGMSYKQIRDRVTKLGPLIDPHIVEGKNNTKMVKDSGRAILDRLIQLERDGHTIQAAVSIIEEEVASNGDPRSGGVKELRDTLLTQLQARLNEQGDQIAFLHDQIKEYKEELAELRGQVRLMLPESAGGVRKPWWRRLIAHLSLNRAVGSP